MVRPPSSDAGDRLAAAWAVVQSSVVWDNVFPLEPRFGNDWDKLDLLTRHGWTAVSMTVSGDEDNAGQALARVAAARHYIHSHPEQMLLLESAADVMQAKQSGRVAVGLHFQGTRCLERNLDLVESFYCLGVRHALLAFNNANSAGGGCAEPDGGLTKYGRRLVREMERVGMLLDLSHTGHRTSLDALDIATRPVVFSHSNADTVASHWRNVRDDQIAACAATGGLIGLSGSSGYLGDPAASTEAMFRHLDYLVTRAGADHVGLGFDLVFDAPALNAWLRTRPDEWPEAGRADWPGFRYAEPPQLVELVAMLLAHGYAEVEIKKILGDNYLRIATGLWG